MEEKCVNCEDRQACVPFFAHENAIMHCNRANKRMLIALCVSLTLMLTLALFLGWMFLSAYNEREKGWQEIIHRYQVTEGQDAVYEQPNP